MLRAISQLQVPENYQIGRENEPQDLPRSVLLFSRNRTDDLVRRARASFQHHRFVFLFSFRGSGNVHVNERTLRLHEGSAILIFPFDIHLYSEVDSDDICWLFITFESRGEGHYSPLRGRTLKLSDDARYLMSKLLSLWEHEYSGLACALGLLLEECKQIVGNTPRSGKNRNRSGISSRINQLIHAQPQRVWAIKEIASELGFSAGHLRRIFQEETAQSLGDYLLDVRINRAAALLVNTDRQVGEVAYACGYDTIYSFSRAFRNRMGVCPRTYRKQFNERNAE